jgi:hypothetical protein
MLHFAQRENANGDRWHFEGSLHYPLDSQKPSVPLMTVEHDFRFRSDVRVIESGDVIISATDGSKREVSIRAVSGFWPGLAGYDYYNDYMSGMWKGSSFMDGFDVDVTDPNVLKKVSMLSETLCEVRCGNEVGYGLVEMVCMGKYPRYGFQGYE